MENEIPSSPVQPLSSTPSAASLVTTCSTDPTDHQISQSVPASVSEAAIPGEVLIRKGRFWVKTTPAALIHHVAHAHGKPPTINSTHNSVGESIADARSSSTAISTPKLDEQIPNHKGTPSSTTYPLKNINQNNHHQHHRDSSHYRSTVTGDIVAPARPASAPLMTASFKSINLDEQISHPSNQRQQPSFYSFLASSKKHDETGNLYHSKLKHHDRSSSTSSKQQQKRYSSQVSSPTPTLSPSLHVVNDHKDTHHVKIYEDDHSEHGSRVSSRKKSTQTKANELDDMLSKMKDYMNSIVSDYELLRNQYQNKTTEVCS